MARQATLIFNPNAGGDSLHAEDLLDALRDAGFDPAYTPTESEEELKPLLDKTEGLVVAAGGDGTLRAVALHLIEKRGVELALIPLGTANNIANTLNLSGEPTDLICTLEGCGRASLRRGPGRGPLGHGPLFRRRRLRHLRRHAYPL